MMFGDARNNEEKCNTQRSTFYYTSYFLKLGCMFVSKDPSVTIFVDKNPNFRWKQSSIAYAAHVWFWVYRAIMWPQCTQPVPGVGSDGPSLSWSQTFRYSSSPPAAGTSGGENTRETSILPLCTHILYCAQLRTSVASSIFTCHRNYLAMGPL